MKHLIRTGMFATSVLFFTACGNDSEKVAIPSEDHAKHGQVDSASAGGVRIKDDKLDAVYQHYVHLTNALINADVAEAKIAANAIETGAKEIAGGETVGAASAKIVAAKDIEEQRVIYSDLSNNFIALVKKAGVDNGTLHVDFCPMALNDKGAYWLSATKAIRNPYFGEKMLNCGEVKETIE